MRRRESPSALTSNTLGLAAAECKQFGYQHVCQACQAPCEKGDGRHACAKCRVSADSTNIAVSARSTRPAPAEMRTIKVEVPGGQFVSYLVGKGGQSISALQAKTGAMVQVASVSTRTDGDAPRHVLLRGPAEAVELAEMAVRERVKAWFALPAQTEAMRTPDSSPPTEVDPQKDDDLLCVVCLDAPRTHLLIPCGQCATQQQLNLNRLHKP
jgi:hypothetical protein